MAAPKLNTAANPVPALIGVIPRAIGSSSGYKNVERPTIDTDTRLQAPDCRRVQAAAGYRVQAAPHIKFHATVTG